MFILMSGRSLVCGSQCVLLNLRQCKRVYVYRLFSRLQLVTVIVSASKLIYIVMVFLGHVYYNADLEQDWTHSTHCGFLRCSFTTYQLLEILKTVATFRTVCLMF